MGFATAEMKNPAILHHFNENFHIELPFRGCDLDYESQVCTSFKYIAFLVFFFGGLSSIIWVINMQCLFRNRSLPLFSTNENEFSRGATYDHVKSVICRELLTEHANTCSNNDCHSSLACTYRLTKYSIEPTVKATFTIHEKTRPIHCRRQQKYCSNL